MAPAILAILALLIVAGSLGRTAPAPALQPRVPNLPDVAVGPEAREPIPATGAGPSTIRGVYQYAIGGRIGCAALMIMSLLLLGPACYTPSIYARLLVRIWPGLPRWGWALLGALLAWPLVATGIGLRLELNFSILGAAVAPITGAIAADFLRQRGRWPGPRPGVNLAGVLAWIVGLLVGLVPVVGPAVGWPAAARRAAGGPAGIRGRVPALSPAGLAGLGAEDPG